MKGMSFLILCCYVPDIISQQEFDKLVFLSDKNRIEKAFKLPTKLKQTTSLVGGLMIKLIKKLEPLNYVSLSHSQNVVVAISSSTPVGIDVQKIVKVKTNSWKKVCGSDELCYLLHSKAPTEDFIKFWTMKEAYYKTIGNGPALPVMQNLCCVKNPPAGIEFQSSKIFEHYYLSICYKKQGS